MKDTQKSIGAEEREEFIDANEKIFEWINAYFDHDVGIEEVSKSDLKAFFEGCGAKEPSAEVRKKLAFKHYGQKQRSAVMKSIWGEKYDDFENWVEKEYIPQAEDRGQKIYHLKNKPNSKKEGMLSFFADMTALAFATRDDYSFDNFDLVTTTRIDSYQKHVQGGWKKEDFQIHIPGYNNDKKFAPASFPPDFPSKALEKIRSWSNLS